MRRKFDAVAFGIEKENLICERFFGRDAQRVCSQILKGL